MAEGIESALAIAADWDTVDVVVADFQLGGRQTGIQLMRQLERPFFRPFFILMSGDESGALHGAIIDWNRQLGALRFHFVEKPIGPRTFLDIFVRLLNFVDHRPIPYMMARCLERLDAEANADREFMLIKDLVEVVLRYSLAIAASLPPCPGAAVRRIAPEAGLGLGTLIHWLEDLRPRMADDAGSDVGPALDQFLFGQRSRQGFLRSAWRVKGVRDSVLAHGYTLDPGAYGALATEHRGLREEIARSLGVFARWPLISPLGFDFDDDDCFRYRSRELMGQSPLTVGHSTSVRLRVGHVYLRLGANRFLDLHPFLGYVPCPACNDSRVFMLDRLGPRQACAKALCNHELDWSAQFEEIRAHLLD